MKLTEQNVQKHIVILREKVIAYVLRHSTHKLSREMRISRGTIHTFIRESRKPTFLTALRIKRFFDGLEEKEKNA